MYQRQSRLSDRKRERLIEHFVARKTGRAAAELVGVHRNTAASFYTRLRKVIAEETEKEMERASPVGGEIELHVVDFRYFYKYSRDWDAGSEVIVFSIFKRGGKVYTEVMPNIQPASLMSIMERLILPDSVVYTYGDPEYDALDVSNFKHVRPKDLNLSFWVQDDLLGIVEFWMRVFDSVAHFHGIPKQSVHLFLKEFEWRYNGLYLSEEKQGLEQGLGALTNQLKAWVRLRQKRT